LKCEKIIGKIYKALRKNYLTAKNLVEKFKIYLFHQQKNISKKQKATIEAVI